MGVNKFRKKKLHGAIESHMWNIKLVTSLTRPSPIVGEKILVILLGYSIFYSNNIVHAYLLQVLRNEITALKEQVQSLLGYMAHCACDHKQGALKLDEK